MARTLADLSRALGWRTDLIAGQDFTAADASERSIVVVATQGHHDEEAITAAIEARPAYVGLVGSARRGATVLGYLAERGVPQGELDKVQGPGGPGPGPHDAPGDRGRDPRRACPVAGRGLLPAGPGGRARLGTQASVRGPAPGGAHWRSPPPPEQRTPSTPCAG